MSAEKPKTLEELRARRDALKAETEGTAQLTERRQLEAEIAAMEKKLQPPFKERLKQAAAKEALNMGRGLLREVKDILAIGPMKCEKHPDYTGAKFPKYDCERCIEIFRAKHPNTESSLL